MNSSASQSAVTQTHAESRPYYNFGLVRVTQDFNLFRVWNRNTGEIRHFRTLDKALACAMSMHASKGDNVWACALPA